MKKSNWFSLFILITFLTCLFITFASAQDQPLVTDPSIDEDTILSSTLYVYPLEPGGSAFLSGPYSTLNKYFEIYHPWFLDGADWPTEPLWMTDIATPVPTYNGTALRYILGGDSFGEVDYITDNCPYSYWHRPFLSNNVFIKATINKDDFGYILSVKFTGNETAYQEYPVDSGNYNYYANMIPLSEQEEDFNSSHDPILEDPVNHPNGCLLSVYPGDYFYNGSVLYILAPPKNLWVKM